MKMADMGTMTRLEEAVLKFLTAEQAVEEIGFELKKLQRLNRAAKTALRDARYQMELQTDFRAIDPVSVEECGELYVDYLFPYVAPPM